MINSKNIGYSRIYFEARDFEEYVESCIGERFRGKPIMLTDVIFDKPYGGTIDMHFTIVMGDDEVGTSTKAKENEDVWNHWDCDRWKASPRSMGMMTLFRMMEDNGINVRDENGEFDLTPSALRELADILDDN